MSLVISRRLNEIVTIGDSIEIEVVGIFRGQVRLAIRAPREIAVDRLEIKRLKDAGIPPPARR